MAVAVMHVGIVRVLVPQLRMDVAVAVRLAGRVVRPMSMAMMFVMDMPVLVLQRLVLMLVFMLLGQVQP